MVVNSHSALMCKLPILCIVIIIWHLKYRGIMFIIKSNQIKYYRQIATPITIKQANVKMDAIDEKTAC